MHAKAVCMDSIAEGDAEAQRCLHVALRGSLLMVCIHDSQLLELEETFAFRAPWTVTARLLGVVWVLAVHLHFLQHGPELRLVSE